VAAHLYRTSGSDASYTTTVTATDGTNTASCNLGVTAYDPNGANGFPGAATTCVSSSGTPVAGSGDCPVGAAVLSTSSVQTALANAYGSGKRLLFKCGDTFTGDSGGNNNMNGVKAAVGAYGGCQDTQTGRPILKNTGGNALLQFSGTSGNVMISDLDCEGAGIGGANLIGGCIQETDAPQIAYQVTIYNVLANAEVESYAYRACSQCGFVQSAMTGMGNSTSNTWIGTWINVDAYSHYPWTGNTFNNNYYQAVIGSHFDGGTTYARNNAETVRIFSCQYCYVANSDFENAGPGYAQLKMHDGGTGPTWIGQYTQYVEIGDNYFAGLSGANAVEIAPQADIDDERLRYIVIDRNVWWQSQATSGRQLLVSGQYISVRDNAFYLGADSSSGLQVCQRGIEPAPQYVEGYNNSFYAASGSYSGAAITIASNCDAGSIDTANSYFQNNLGYFPGNQGGTISIVQNGSGSGNVISNNTSSTLLNPAWTDSSGTFKRISDWKPTANYSGGISVPVYFDALGLSWLSTWDLGAVEP
jgi:hypothetical protein